MGVLSVGLDNQTRLSFRLITYTNFKCIIIFDQHSVVIIMEIEKNEARFSALVYVKIFVMFHFLV